MNSYSYAQIVQLSRQEKVMKSEHPSQLGVHPIKEKSSTTIFMEKRTDQIQKNNPRMTLEARDDFFLGSFVFRHHVQLRVKLYVPQEGSFPIPLNNIDVVKRTNTTLDASLESRIDACWSVDGDRMLSGPWTAFPSLHIIERKASE